MGWVLYIRVMWSLPIGTLGLILQLNHGHDTGPVCWDKTTEMGDPALKAERSTGTEVSGVEAGVRSAGSVSPSCPLLVT